MSQKTMWGSLSSATGKLKSITLSAALLTSVFLSSSCTPISQISVTDRLVMVQLVSEEGSAVLTESGTVWCYAGKVHYTGHVLKEGQAYKGRTLYKFSLGEFFSAFPELKPPDPAPPELPSFIPGVYPTRLLDGQ